MGVFLCFSIFCLLLVLLPFAPKLTPVAKLIGVIGAEVPVAPDVELTPEEKRGKGELARTESRAVCSVEENRTQDLELETSTFLCLLRLCSHQRR